MNFNKETVPVGPILRRPSYSSVSPLPRVTPVLIASTTGSLGWSWLFSEWNHPVSWFVSDSFHTVCEVHSCCVERWPFLLAPCSTLGLPHGLLVVPSPFDGFSVLKSMCPCACARVFGDRDTHLCRVSPSSGMWCAPRMGCRICTGSHQEMLPVSLSGHASLPSLQWCVRATTQGSQFS